MGLFGNSSYFFSSRFYQLYHSNYFSAVYSALFELRRDLTNHILHLPQSYFDKTSSGDLILKLVNQVQELSLFVGQTTVKAMRDAATVLIVSSYLIYKNIYLFSVALVVIPLIAFLMIAVVKRVRKLQALAEKSIENTFLILMK